MGNLNSLNGRVLKVDLNAGEVSTTEEASEIHRSFLGGRGLNQFYLYNLLVPTTSPLDPESVLLFGSGLLSGTLVPGATRISIDAKNYFSDGVGSASAGEGFSPALKRAGYGTIIVTGKARDPVYLWIDNDVVRIEPAKEFWGRTTSETVDRLRELLGQDVHVACIGPAGENRVRGASVMVNRSRAAGKCGLGAVMGSKNLKAIAVRGSGIIQVAKPKEFGLLCRDVLSKVTRSEAIKTLSAWGTKSLRGKNAVCGIAFRHFQDGHMRSLEGIDEHAFAQYEQRRFSCSGCPVCCRQIFRIETGPYAGVEGESIQANSVQDFGAKLDIRYVPAIIKAHVLCNEFGVDIDTAAESIGWAFECYEKGLLTEKDTDGLRLEWGNHETLMNLIERIAHRRGFGDILAEGVQRASEIIGRGSQELAVSMKGQDLYEDMRIPKGYALGAALSTRGGGHCSGSPLVEFALHGSASKPLAPEVAEKVYGFRTAVDPASYEGKAELVAYHERMHAVLNSLGVCFFVSVWESFDLLNERDFADLIAAATGWDMDAVELMEVGERIHTLERLFNALHAGFDRKDDYPCERFFCEPIRSGPYKGEVLHREEFDRMLDKNYEIHGWNERGLPKLETLEKLGLSHRLNRLPDNLMMNKVSGDSCPAE